MMTATFGRLADGPVQNAPGLMTQEITGSRDVARLRSGSKKSIPPGLRRRRSDFLHEPIWYKRLLWRLREDSQFLRSVVQYSFLLLCTWIGVEFCFFMQWGMDGGSGSITPRPPGVEGFLPISALMSLKHYLSTGIINAIHPAALSILVAILLASLLVKKAFCSWLCPIGTLSESLWLLGQKIFGRNLILPRWFDYSLRSLKYLLLAFFLWSILAMDTSSLERFIYSPYNKVADIKMYLFFAQISGVALGTILVLIALSVVIKNFWCRFLCPYGALLGVVSLLSPLKITRIKSTCIDCEKCTKACPSNIKVHEVTRVWSDECMSCMACVEVCPVKNTLNMQRSQTSRPIPTWVLGTLVVGVFMAVTGLAMITGHWQNGISRVEYQRRFLHLDDAQYQHFRGQAADYGPND